MRYTSHYYCYHHQWFFCMGVCYLNENTHVSCVTKGPAAAAAHFPNHRGYRPLFVSPLYVVNNNVPNTTFRPCDGVAGHWEARHFPFVRLVFLRLFERVLPTEWDSRRLRYSSEFGGWLCLGSACCE